jgi:hypothetical protein
MSHTPAPWYLGGEFEAGVTCDIHTGHEQLICNVEPMMDEWTPEEIANASLICAAPDLLAALRRAEMKLAAYVGVCKDDKELTDTILPMIDRAIQKANGV